MTLKEYAFTLKKRLMLNPTADTAKQITIELKNKKYSDGSNLTPKDIEYILDIIRYDRDDNGHVILKDSDNSTFLKTVALLKSNINDNEGK